MSNTVTLVGNVASDPKFEYLSTGAAKIKFSLAVNRWRAGKNGEKGEEVLEGFFVIEAWRELAEHLAELLGEKAKGTRLIVVGRMKLDTWEKDGQKQSMVKVEADAIGPDLRFATATVTKPARSGGEG
jgi:single-strand DNA-binding protein